MDFEYEGVEVRGDGEGRVVWEFDAGVAAWAGGGEGGVEGEGQDGVCVGF